MGPVPVLSEIPANTAWIRDGVNGILTSIEPAAVADAIRRALGVDRVAYAAKNRALVAERADRDRNLTAFEARLEAVVAAARPARTAARVGA